MTFGSIYFVPGMRYEFIIPSEVRVHPSLLRVLMIRLRVSATTLLCDLCLVLSVSASCRTMHSDYGSGGRQSGPSTYTSIYISYEYAIVDVDARYLLACIDTSCLHLVLNRKCGPTLITFIGERTYMHDHVEQQSKQVSASNRQTERERYACV